MLTVITIAFQLLWTEYWLALISLLLVEEQLHSFN